MGELRPPAREDPDRGARRAVAQGPPPEDPEVRRLAASRDLVIVPMPADVEGFAARLYATLHALDQRQLDRIIVDRPPDDEVWRAVRDRLTRAAVRT